MSSLPVEVPAHVRDHVAALPERNDRTEIRRILNELAVDPTDDGITKTSFSTPRGVLHFIQGRGVFASYLIEADGVTIVQADIYRPGPTHIL